MKITKEKLQIMGIITALYNIITDNKNVTYGEDSFGNTIESVAAEPLRDFLKDLEEYVNDI